MKPPFPSRFSEKHSPTSAGRELIARVTGVLAVVAVAALSSFSPAHAEVAPANSSSPLVAVKVSTPIRIKAGLRKSFIDAEGNTWLPDQGFVDGVIADRDVITSVANTKNPTLYRSERYGMTAFSQPLTNGKYVVRLHFAEMYERVTGPGQRVFSFTVEGHEVKDFDLWSAAGGPRRAYVESVSVTVADGSLDITFVKNLQFTTINAIEIIPAELVPKGK